MLQISEYSFLVVDDSPVNQAILKHRLTRLGANVTLASNGREALAICERQVFDLVFLDIQMPELDGFSTVTQLKNLYPKTIVIAWTCSIDESSIQYFEAGFDGFLDKPIHKQSFIAILTEHLHIQQDQAVHEDLNIDFIVSELAVHSKEIVTVHSGLLKSLPERVSELKDIFAENNWEELIFQSRKLRGTAKLNGLSHLSELLRTIEYAARTENSNAISSTLQTLSHAIVRFKDEYSRSSIDV